MATTTKRATATPIPWYSWLALAGVLVVGAIIVIVTSRPVLPDWLRWVVTIAWILVTLGLGLYDFILGGGTRAAETFRAAAIDVKPFDRWTVSHTGAGLVFGVWFLPLVWVLVLVIAWEAFEMFVPGFGESEILANRAVDIGVALAGWLLLVVIGIIATPGTSFPIV
jgi:hypothetical protein